MSTDRELLELAARAAGLGELVFMSEPERYEVVWLPVGSDCNQWMPWNPLTDDGDALRLVVKLSLRIWSDGTGVVVESTGYPASACEYELAINCNGCIYAATRHAIVRAAAEIGRNMP